MIEFEANDIFLVTGSTSGIGRSVILMLNELGGKTIAISRNVDALKKLRDHAQNPTAIYPEVMDLTNKQENLHQWVLDLASRYGKLKGAVLSAGEQQITPLRAVNLAKAKDLFDINYFANIALCQGFCDRRANRGEGSSVVFLSSIASITGNAGLMNYSATKGAINSAVKAMAIEMAKEKIRVNAVLPGFVKTGIVDKWRDIYTNEYLDKLDKDYPLGIGKPEYVANMVVFLLSDRAQWITGGNFVVDGGASL